MDADEVQRLPELRALFHIAEEMGVYISISRDMGTTLWGVYEHHVRAITLNALLDAEQRCLTLAHEIGHAWYGHEHDGPAHGDPEQERLADEIAAHLLVLPGRYADAERLRGPHPGAIADELGVHQEAVETYQRVLRRTRPEIRARQWAHPLAARRTA